MTTDPLAYLTAHPSLLIVVVFAAAALEYIFPPFWGDTFMLAGFAVAGFGRAASVAVFAAALLGSCVGAWVAYLLGRRFGRASLAWMGRSPRARRIADRAERLHANHGARVLALNRFLPGVRALFLPMAGMSNMPVRSVLLWSGVSNVLYCAMLLGLGLALGATSPDFANLQGRFREASLIAAGVAVLVLMALTARHFVLRAREAKAR